MTWIRIPTVNKQFMNIGTLTCIRRNENNGTRVRVRQCRNTNASWQKTECIQGDNGIKIRWNVNEEGYRFLHLQYDDEHAISSTSGSDQLWDKEKNPCNTSSDYNGMVIHNLV